MKRAGFALILEGLQPCIEYISIALILPTWEDKLGILARSRGRAPERVDDGVTNHSGQGRDSLGPVKFFVVGGGGV